VKYDPEDDAYFGEDPEPEERKPAPILAYTAVGLLTGAVLLLIFIAIAGSHVLVVTPFVMVAGGAAAAGATGVSCSIAARKIPISAVKQTALLLAAFLIAAALAGGGKYAYGGSGAANIDLEFEPDHLAKGIPANITGSIIITNAGASTIRVNPHFELYLIDPSGVRALRFLQGCPIAVPPPPTEARLIEIAPGAKLVWPFKMAVVWSDSTGAVDVENASCGAAILQASGTHGVTGFFSSQTFDAPALVPVWSGELTSARHPLEVS